MKKIFIIFCVSCFIFITYQCNNKNNSIDKYRISENSDNHIEHQGKALTQTYCISCHTNDAKIAPSFYEIKEVYTQDGVSKEEFIMNIKAFLHEPSIENAKLPDAVQKFGLMPKLSFKDEEIELIADFLLETDLKNYDWKVENINNSSIEKTWEEKGRELMMQTKQTLGKNLLEAIQTKGTSGALEFCNTKAITITDSMSKVLDATIKRVSDKPRNATNLASSEEIAFINELKQKIAKGEKLTPKVIEENNKVIAYYGIETNAMCLQCHGEKNKDISKETLAKINQYYPNDKATGYAEKQIRGLFVVEMKK
jgi:mono/diheme cytochrome c family protein/cytochrome c553